MSELNDLRLLIKRKEQLEQEIEKKRDALKNSVLEAILEQARESGLTLSEIERFLSKKLTSTSKTKRAKIEPKYQDPATGMSWSGRGKPPAWIAGKNKDKFLIK